MYFRDGWVAPPETIMLHCDITSRAVRFNEFWMRDLRMASLLTC
jgi:hypothetical protein